MSLKQPQADVYPKKKDELAPQAPLFWPLEKNQNQNQNQKLGFLSKNTFCNFFEEKNANSDPPPPIISSRHHAYTIARIHVSRMYEYNVSYPRIIRMRLMSYTIPLPK